MPAQWHVCNGCKQRKADTRKYIQNGKTLRYCVSCSYKQSGLKVAVQQRVPERFK